MTTTVDFVVDFGAPTNGTSDCATAVGALNTYMLNPLHNDVILTVPAHTYVLVDASVDFALSAGNSKLVVQASSATFARTAGGVWFFGNSGQQTIGHEARIKTVAAGATVVELVTSSENSRFAVGRYVIVTSLDVGENGQPSGQHNFQYAQVTDITGAFIALDRALTDGHKSTYPLFFSGSPGEVDMGGPATIYDMPVAWDIDFELIGCTINNGAAQTYSKCRKTKFTSVICAGTGGIVPTVNQTHTWNTVNCSACDIEIDKLVENWSTTNSSIGSLGVQSSCVNATHDNLTVGTNYIGTGRATTIANSTIPLLRIGPQSHGVSDSVIITNSTITAAEQSDVFLRPDVLEWTGGGTFRCTNAEALSTVSTNLRSSCVPGHKYRFAFYDGSIHDVDATGRKTTFTILNLRQDATYTYIDTDLVALPSPPQTFSGSPANQYVAYASSIVTQSGTGPADFTEFRAPLALVTPVRVRFHS